MIAYLTNQFPSPVEPYVRDEIMELRQRGMEVIPCSARLPKDGFVSPELEELVAETLYLEPLQILLLIRAAWFCMRRLKPLADLFLRFCRKGASLLGGGFGRCCTPGSVVITRCGSKAALWNISTSTMAILLRGWRWLRRDCSAPDSA